LGREQWVWPPSVLRRCRSSGDGWMSGQAFGREKISKCQQVSTPTSGNVKAFANIADSPGHQSRAATVKRACCGRIAGL